MLNQHFFVPKLGQDHKSIVSYEGEGLKSRDNNKLGEYKVPLQPYTSIEAGKFNITLEINKIIFNL